MYNRAISKTEHKDTLHGLVCGKSLFPWQNLLKSGDTHNVVTIRKKEKEIIKKNDKNLSNEMFLDILKKFSLPVVCF